MGICLPFVCFDGYKTKKTQCFPNYSGLRTSCQIFVFSVFFGFGLIQNPERYGNEYNTFYKNTIGFCPL